MPEFNVSLGENPIPPKLIDCAKTGNSQKNIDNREKNKNIRIIFTKAGKFKVPPRTRIQDSL
jgi:hypothetical protein